MTVFAFLNRGLCVSNITNSQLDKYNIQKTNILQEIPCSNKTKDSWFSTSHLVLPLVLPAWSMVPEEEHRSWRKGERKGVGQVPCLPAQWAGPGWRQNVGRVCPYLPDLGGGHQSLPPPHRGQANICEEIIFLYTMYMVGNCYNSSQTRCNQKRIMAKSLCYVTPQTLNKKLYSMIDNHIAHFTAASVELCISCGFPYIHFECHNCFHKLEISRHNCFHKLEIPLENGNKIKLVDFDLFLLLVNIVTYT